MNRFDLPQDLVTVIGSEQVDFAVYAKRKRPKSYLTFIILFAFIGLILPGIGAMAFFVSVSNESTPIKADNSEPMSSTSLLLILIVIIGVGYLISKMISRYKKKRGHFVGTKSRMIYYFNGNIQYFDWTQFTGNIELNFNAKSISLEMRRKNYNAMNKEPDNFVPETLHFTNVENLAEVERICRDRIKENDSFPPLATKVKYKSSYKK